MSDSLLEIRNLTKRYGENTVLRDLSFTVRRGEVIVCWDPAAAVKAPCCDVSTRWNRSRGERFSWAAR